MHQLLHNAISVFPSIGTGSVWPKVKKIKRSNHQCSNYDHPCVCLTWYDCVGYQERGQSASRLHVHFEVLVIDLRYIISRKCAHVTSPWRRMVFSPLGALSASWSKVKISPPAFKMRALAPSVTCNAQIC